jgi:hypothetical protein
MSTHAKTLTAEEVAIATGDGDARVPATRDAIARPSRLRADRQLRVLVAIGALILIVPATIGWLTRWRWQPWPPGRDGYGSVLHEAHVAAAAYVPIGFGGL